MSAAARGKAIAKPRRSRRPRIQRPPLPPAPRGPSPQLSALELERIVTLREAAELLGLSYHTLWRYHRDRFLSLSPNRRGIRLRDVIAIGEAVA
jgi:hypothetical protein